MVNARIHPTFSRHVANGAAIGILAGFGTSMLSLLATCREGVDCSGMEALVVGAIGVGAAIVVTIDALVHRRETIYRNPAGACET
jgi:hypothetical protein